MTSRRLVLAFATTVRVVDRVHNRTTDGRADALPAVTASLADLDVGMLGVADFANGRAAGEQHAAHLRRGHAQNGVLAFLTHELDRSTSGASQRSTLAGLPEQTQEEIFLYYFQHLTQKEIGEQSGWTRSTIGRHIQLALKRLKEEMEVLSHE